MEGISSGSIPAQQTQPKQQPPRPPPGETHGSSHRGFVWKEGGTSTSTDSIMNHRFILFKGHIKWVLNSRVSHPSGHVKSTIHHPPSTIHHPPSTTPPKHGSGTRRRPCRWQPVPGHGYPPWSFRKSQGSSHTKWLKDVKG